MGHTACLKTTAALSILILSLAMVGVPTGECARKQAAKTFVVVGTGTITGNDHEAAKSAAIADAKLTAVELVAAEILPLETLVDRFNDLNAIVYLKPDGFIEYYRVLNELKTERDYRVLVQATVSSADLEKKLKSEGILQSDTEMSRAIELTVEGTKDLPHFVQFRRSLTDLDGVESAQMREMRTDAAVMSIQWQGTTDLLADTLVRQRYEGFSIRVYQAADNALRVELLPE
jgi:hypothetical protein